MTGMALSDIDTIELNEAFAAQAIGCMRELGIEKGDLWRWKHKYGAHAASTPRRGFRSSRAHETAPANHNEFKVATYSRNPWHLHRNMQMEKSFARSCFRCQ